jgi:hypothetical protein
MEREANLKLKKVLSNWFTCKENILFDRDKSLLDRLPFTCSAGFLQEESQKHSPEIMTVGTLMVELLCPVNSS